MIIACAKVLNPICNLGKQMTVPSKRAFPALSIEESIGVLVLTMVVLSMGVNASTNVLNAIQFTLAAFWLVLSAVLLHYATTTFFIGKTIYHNSDFLNTRTKWMIGLLGIVNPAFVGIVVVLLWHKTNYLKARQANLFALVALIVRVLLALVLSRIA